MSQYLRDSRLTNLTIGEEELRKINSDLVSMQEAVNGSINIKENSKLENKLLIRSYIIRFDSRGYKVFSFEEVIQYFQDAKKIDQFVFILDSLESMQRIVGKHIEIRFYANDPANSQLIVQDDDKNWVDMSFPRLQERVCKYKNSHFIVRNIVSPHFIQLCGVVFGILGSFLLANKISTKLSIENAFAFSFIVLLLLFSNIWGPIYAGILALINYLWPNVAFKARKSAHWVVQLLVGSIVIFLLGILINNSFQYVSNSIKAILK